MPSCTRQSLLACSFVLLAVSAAAGDAPPAKPTTKQIAHWVEQLGDDRFAVRENASKQLWLAGEAAESAVEKAVQSNDPEVARRARDLLDKFRWGIYPDTPADIVALIRAYQGAENNARDEVLRKLLQSGNAGLQSVLKIARAEPDENRKKVLHDLIAQQLPAAFLQAVMENKYAKFEMLLEYGRRDKFIGHSQYAAYALLRGQLAERIAEVRAQLSKNPEDKWLAESLAYLHRANGDLPQAGKAAEQSGNAKLIDDLLFEAGDWKALAARPLRLAQDNGNDLPYLVGLHNAEKWAFRAAYARLAGIDKEFDNAVRELRKITGDDPRLTSSAFVAAKALLLNDRPKEGRDILGTLPSYENLLLPSYPTFLFDLHCARLDYAAALKMEEASTAAKTPSRLDMAKARILCLLGKKDEGEARFARFAEHIKDEADPDWIKSLLTEERRAGLTELVLEHAAKALSVSLPKRDVDRANGRISETLYLSTLFPQQSSAAETWWPMLRRKFKDESAAAVLKRLHQLMAKKIAAKEVKAWIDEADRLLSQPGNPFDDSNDAEKLAARRQALAETAVAAGLDDLAASLLEKTDTRDGLLRLGDLLAAKKQWAKAAERYRQAWKKELSEGMQAAEGAGYLSAGQDSYDPLPLYLAGDALVRAGQNKEGKELIEQAHAIPLADDAARFRFSRSLTERGHVAAARRETELLLRLSEPNSYYFSAAIRSLALAALARKDYPRAVQGFEQSLLRCLHPSTNFVSAGGYANAPAHIHQLRASALLAAGKLDAARKEIDWTLTVSPGYVDLPIALVPDLDRRGHKKDAAALFDRCYGTYAKVCRDYPRCAWAHNSAAWLSACCRRNLDKALEHAGKAVELAPANAGYLDTLAEVHFQRGDKDKAVALQKRVVELDPKKAYFRKQLKRLEAGDPAAERPPEDEE